MATDGKAESSKAQFRELFERYEPKLLKFADSMLKEFGRQNIAVVRIYCPIDHMEKP